MEHTRLTPVLYNLHGPAARCFCKRCTDLSGDERVHERGDPPRRYVMPAGCARVGVTSDRPRALAAGAFDTFHYAYHGTKVGVCMGCLGHVLVFAVRAWFERACWAVHGVAVVGMCR